MPDEYIPERNMMAGLSGRNATFYRLGREHMRGAILEGMRRFRAGPATVTVGGDDPDPVLERLFAAIEDGSLLRDVPDGGSTGA